MDSLIAELVFPYCDIDTKLCIYRAYRSADLQWSHTKQTSLITAKAIQLTPSRPDKTICAYIGPYLIEKQICPDCGAYVHSVWLHETHEYIGAAVYTSKGIEYEHRHAKSRP